MMDAKNTQPVSGRAWARDGGMLCLGAMIASTEWWFATGRHAAETLAAAQPVAAHERESPAHSAPALPPAPVPGAASSTAAAVVQADSSATPGHRVQTQYGQVPPPPAEHDPRLDGLADEALRQLAKQGDVDAMLTLAERLMDPARQATSGWESTTLLEDALAHGSTEAAMALGENMMKNKFQYEPEASEVDLLMTRQLAAAHYVTALMMGDLRALEGVQAVLPSNPSSVYIVGMLRGGYFGYQRMLDRRAELGLPPFSAHFPPYRWTPEQRLMYDIMHKQ
jgi:hypothetical protein